MITFSILISNSEVNGPGGLFDINATLPLVIIQFYLISFILNIFLFTPVLGIIDKRNNYTSDNLEKASRILLEADNVTSKSKKELDEYKNSIRLNISLSQEINKEILELTVKAAESEIDDLLSDIFYDFLRKKEFAYKRFNGVVESLSVDLEKQFINTSIVENSGFAYF